MKSNWTKEEIEKFKELYPTTSQDILSKIFKRTVSALETKAYRLGIKKVINTVGKRIFLQPEMDFIFENLDSMSVPKIAKILNRDKNSIYEFLEKINLQYKTSEFWWTEKEIEFLKDNYEKLDKEFIVSSLGKKWGAISKKARILGLHRYKKNGDVYLPNPSPIGKKEELYIRENCHNLTFSEIARNLNRGIEIVKSFCIKNNIQVFKIRKTPKNFSNDFLLDKLKFLEKELGRTPTIADIQSEKDVPAIDIYYDRFGSFSNACEMAGLKANGGSFGTICYSKNGDRCFSIREQIITNFFIEKSIVYEKEKFYSDIIKNFSTSHRMDWYLSNSQTVVEFFGLMKKDFYNENVKFKINLCKSNSINILAIFEEDLNQLEKIFKPFIK